MAVVGIGVLAVHDHMGNGEFSFYGLAARFAPDASGK
jgi:hypothetical protein